MPRSTQSVAAILAFALVVLPSVADGQMSARRYGNDPFGGAPAPTVPVHTARAIIENEKDLALTDSQRIQIVLIRRRLDLSAAPLLARLDSVRPTWRLAGGPDDISPEQREQLIVSRTAQTAVIEELTPSYTHAREQIFALLSAEQQKRVAKLEKKERKRAEEQARDARDMRNGLSGQGRRGELRDGTDRAPLG